MATKIIDTASRVVTPFSLRDAPSLIEKLWPAQKISRESEAERKSVAGQTLTGLGGYWKGRKPLLLNRACILGALLPATDDPEKDLVVFERLMMVDDRGFVERSIALKPKDYAKLAIRHQVYSPTELAKVFAVRGKSTKTSGVKVVAISELELLDDEILAQVGRNLVWHPMVEKNFEAVATRILAKVPYDEKIDLAVRPEYLEVEDPDLLNYAWDEVNAHLGTTARSMHQLVEQLGIMRFGRLPKVGDSFSGSGQIPYEALRIGCDTFASDPNPIAALLTWSSFTLAGMAPDELEDVIAELGRIEEEVEDEMARFDTNAEGNRAKAFLYCVEVRCPNTGYLIPLVPNLVISPKNGTIGRLVANHEDRRMDIEIINGASDQELDAAKVGTVADEYVSYTLNDIDYRFSVASVRGDQRENGVRFNGLRPWENDDIVPRADDVFRERLYCIQWATKDSLKRNRQDVFYAAPTADDIKRDTAVVDMVVQNLGQWRADGLVADMRIEPGLKTDDPIRTRGWTNWLHLFHPRQIAMLASLHGKIKSSPRADHLYFFMPRALDNASRLNRWKSSLGGGLGGTVGTFDNQALNTLINFAVRASLGLRSLVAGPTRSMELTGPRRIETVPGSSVAEECDIWVTDPPYADAVVYHELTEFFISWLRRDPPKPFDKWTWDSRRPIAIQGEGEDFRRKMVETYSNLARHMPANGVQIVMFTHQSGAVWADLAQIFWGAGLQVSAAWYIATETGSNAPGKKGTGLVQGTVILVLRKRGEGESGYEDEIAQEVRAEVARQIDTLVGLNQQIKGSGRIENLFEDTDLQMAGYAAALRVLTGYTRIDGRDMTAEASRPRQHGELGFVERIIAFAVQVANEHMVPSGLSPRIWQSLNGTERFYLKMVALEAAGHTKLDNYQNLSRAFRVPNYGMLMADVRPNAARIKGASDFKRRTGFEIPDFGDGVVRAVLYGIWELSTDADPTIVLQQLREMVENYYQRRVDMIEIAEYVTAQRGRDDQKEGRHAAVLANLLRSEKL